MNATVTTLEAATMPRSERELLLSRLRKERDEARRTRLAQGGEGWQVDVMAVQQPRRRLDPGDVDRVLAGDPLPPHRTAGDEDVSRKLAALDVAIKRLTQQRVEDAVHELQRESDAVAERLRTFVADVLRATAKLPAASDLERTLEDARRVLAARNGLHGPDVSNVPMVRHDPALEEIAALIWRGLDFLSEARKVMTGDRK